METIRLYVGLVDREREACGNAWHVTNDRECRGEKGAKTGTFEAAEMRLKDQSIGLSWLDWTCLDVRLKVTPDNWEKFNSRHYI